LQLADIYAARKDWAAALPIYSDLLAKHPGDASLNLSYGLGLVATRRYKDALGPLERARAATPSSQAGIAYARAMKGTGDLKRATKEYERALPQFEKDASFVREYADVLLEKKDYKKAARYYGVAYGLGLRDNRLLEGYVGSLSGAGKYKEELPYLEELYRRHPTPRVAVELAKLMHRLGRNDRAKELLSQLETTSPKQATSRGF
jgi:tetratricopeptide (TPR) repeat protein